jgi:Glycosyltransferase family 28 C-terminal domain
VNIVSRPLVLYVSSSIGLGHASKDLAIAGELRRLVPDIDIVWLAGHPASDVLAEAGEHVLSEASSWIGASDIAEKSMRGGNLNLVRYVYRSLPALWTNRGIVKAAVATHDVDIVVGDEAWEIGVPLVAHALRLPVPFVLLTDFVGLDVMGSNPVDQLGAWGLNALWSFDGAVYNGRPHSAVFVAEIEDIPDRRFGLALPHRRAHAARYYDLAGYAIQFDPDEYRDKATVRRRLGYGDEPLIVCAVGGTSIGHDLLELCGASFPLLRHGLPDLRMVLVCGPRLPVDSVQAPDGVEVRGHVPRLYEHFACADAAVVQSGASSTTELAALERPFIYVPVEGHFEQEGVARRLARHGIGRRMSLAATTPQMLAEAIAEEYGREVPPCTMPVCGARKAAEHIARVAAMAIGP